MVTRKSATTAPAERAELESLFTDGAIKGLISKWAQERVQAEAVKAAAGPDREYLVIKRVCPMVTRVTTQLDYGTADERSEMRYQPGWQAERLTARGTIFAQSAEEAVTKAQRRALGDKKGVLDADEAAYWANHLAQGTWGHGKYAAQAAPVKAKEVLDLSKCPVKGDVPETPDIADLKRRIEFWTRDGDKEMCKALRGMLKQAMKITR